MPSLPQINLPSLDFSSFFSGRKVWLLVGGGILFVLLVVVFLAAAVLRQAGPVTITMWGLWEPESVYQIVADDYKRQHPNVTVKYVKQSPINYRERALSAIARSGGPDVILLHNTWLPMFFTGLTEVPAEVMSLADFRTTFYPVATRDLVAGGKAYALPLEIDTLGLYVNQDIFNSGGVSLPTTWEEFRTGANKLTVRDSGGRIKTAGVAMGAVSNVDHWQDILGLMMLQAGVDLTNSSNSQTAADTLSYYATFQSVDKVWDETLDTSTLAFAKGTLAMYFGPSWRYFDIKSINPNLNFKVIPVPQLSGGKTVNYASYWAAGVSKKSGNAKVAWDFLKFATSEEELTKLYSAEAKLREFGEPYPRVKMATLLSTDPAAGAFVLAAPTAQSWYLASYTPDGETGINSRIGKYFEDAVNSVVRGSEAKSALDTVAKGVTQVLGQYGGQTGPITK